MPINVIEFYLFILNETYVVGPKLLIKYFGWKHPGTIPYRILKGALRENPNIETNTARQWPNEDQSMADRPGDVPSMGLIEWEM